MSVDGDDLAEESSSYDWNSEDELDIQNCQPSPFLTVPIRDAVPRSGEASSSAGLFNYKLFDHFVGMGFPQETVSKVIKKYGEENEDKLLEELLTYSVLEEDSPQQRKTEPEPSSSEYAGSFSDDFSDIDTFSDDEEITKSLSENDDKLLSLVRMGFELEDALPAIDRLGPNSSLEELVDFITVARIAKAEGGLLPPEDKEITKSVSENDGKLLSLVRMGFELEEALPAIDRLGPNTSLEELVDFITVARIAKAEDALLPPEDKVRSSDHSKLKKRSFYDYEILGKKKPRGCEKKTFSEDDEALHIPKPMIGFGVPNEPNTITNRTLPEAAIGPPYFYYENVALAPKGVWQTISRFLYDIEPEFVDSKHFSAAARKRGYVHNLPIQNRFPLLPIPSRTIQEAFPLTRKWWPSWDHRTKLNCLQTVTASARLTDRIRKAVENYDGNPPQHVQKYVLDQCRKWNLVWVGRNKVAPLEADEVEMLLGFPRNHTRGGGISRTERYKSLGNSFQIDTVAYHLSVLKDMYPNGINLLSLFSGIGGAEVALHRLGIPLKNVVSVEKSEVNRNIIRSWWEQTNQKGNLIDIDNIQLLDGDRLEQLMSAFGSFDLIVGGSPCNNLAGSNRCTRNGLEGKDSSLFYDYVRILDLVKCMMAKYR